MGVLGWIFFALVVGVVAKFLTPGRDPGGFFVTILIGIIGAMLGGFIGRGLGWYGAGDPVGSGPGGRTGPRGRQRARARVVGSRGRSPVFSNASFAWSAAARSVLPFCSSS